MRDQRDHIRLRISVLTPVGKIWLFDIINIKGSMFRKVLRTDANFQALPKLAICFNYSVIHYVKFSVLYSFERLDWEELEKVNTKY